MKARVKKKRRVLTWAVLDACKIADEVAELLRAHGIVGVRSRATACPLAKATGYVVSRSLRRRITGGHEPLTPAECVFVRRFDEGWYPFLEAK